jgi:hypothetical protein
MINITKNVSTRVDASFARHGDLLMVKFVRTDDDLGTSTWEMSFDDIDLEHFIATLIEHQE